MDIRIHLTYITLVGLLFLSCEHQSASTEQTVIQAELLFADSLPPVIERDEPLPQQQTQEERHLAKSDRFDIRGSYRDVYGITDPIGGATRAVGEFEFTDSVLISWDWYLDRYMSALVKAVSTRAKVWLITASERDSSAIRSTLTQQKVDLNQIGFFEFKNDSFWTRDYGPWTIADAQGTPAFVDMRYYSERRRDDAIPTLLSRSFSLPVYRADLYIEGGNFMADGQGRCITSARMLEVNYTTNAQEFADLFSSYLGCETVLVLEPLIGEGTGHIDLFTKLMSPNSIIIGAYDPADDPINAELLERNVLRLQRFAEQTDWPLDIIRIPMPRPYGSIYPSYTNSLIVNDLVIVPTYATDRRYEQSMINSYRQAFPGGEIVTIDSDTVIQMGGAVHCTTMGFNLAPVTPADLPPMTPPRLDQPTPTTLPPSPTETESGVYTVTTPQLILDRGVTESTIEVSYDPQISTALINISIDHANHQDLNIKLGLAGRTLTLLNTFEPRSGMYTYQVKLNLAANFDWGGTWRLLIEDQLDADEGQLLEWSINFSE